jgi:two-component system, chemotaxis family, sensor kinase CheA
MSQVSAGYGSGETFRAIFFEEAHEHLGGTETLLLRLDTDAPSAEDLNAVFRAVHSIKGSAAMLGFDEIAALTHVMENLLDLLRRDERPIARDDVDAMLKAGDAIRSQVAHRQGLLAEQPDGSQAEAMLRARVMWGGNGQAAGAGTRSFSVRLGPLTAPIEAQVLEMTLAGLAEMGTVGNRALENVSGGWVSFDVALQGSEFDLHSVLSLVVPVEQIAIESRAAGGLNGAACQPSAQGPGGPRAEHQDEIFVDPAEFRRRRESAKAAAAPARDPAVQGDEGKADLFTTPQGLKPDAAMPAAKSVALADSRGEAAAEPAASSVQADATSIRVGTDKIDLLVNLVGELIITESMLSRQGAQGELNGRQGSHAGLADLARHTRNLQEAVLAIRMVPISNVFARFPRFSRALAERLGKRVELRTSGEGTELDRGLIERISDPLMHLVRNAIDHGLETPEGRVAAGKHPVGCVSLAASQRGGKVVIEVSDDGRGFDRSRILARAAARGMAVAEDAPDSEVWQLVFDAGFTTADAVTDVSGRGVGMDVVRRNIRAMRGTVDLASSPGRGTTVTVSIPLTLAIINGFLVGVGSSTYVIPLEAVVECLELSGGDRARVIRSGHMNLRGKVLPLLRLCEVFDTPGEPGKRENVIVVNYAGRHAGLVVDALLGEFQTVIKPLGKLFDRLAGISGSTILGSGEVALILDVPYLIQSSTSRRARIT